MATGLLLQFPPECQHLSTISPGGDPLGQIHGDVFSS
jgi:hypothetical protein